MHFRTTFQCDCLALFLGLYAFRRRNHPKSLGKRSDGPHNIKRASALVDVLNEGTIDFDLVERKTLQIAERRIPRAEVVNGYAHAQLTELVQRCKGGLAVLQQDRLGDFQFQTVRRQT